MDIWAWAKSSVLCWVSVFKPKLQGLEVGAESGQQRRNAGELVRGSRGPTNGEGEASEKKGESKEKASHNKSEP